MLRKPFNVKAIWTLSNLNNVFSVLPLLMVSTSSFSVDNAWDWLRQPLSCTKYTEWYCKILQVLYVSCSRIHLSCHIKRLFVETLNSILFTYLQPNSQAFGQTNYLTDNVGRWTCLVLSLMPVVSLCEDLNNKCPVSDVLPSRPLPTKQILAACGQSWDQSFETVQQKTKIKQTKTIML